MANRHSLNDTATNQTLEGAFETDLRQETGLRNIESLLDNPKATGVVDAVEQVDNFTP